MDQKLDVKIQSILLENNISIPEECKIKIQDVLKKLPEDKYNKRSSRLLPAVIITVICLLISSATVFAAINYVRSRMEKLPQSVKNSYYQGLQDSTVDADSYSREMTKDEKERMEELKQKYNKGTFPAHAITIVKAQIDTDGRDELYFAEDTSFFHLPVRDLTDEEMLQIIDFYYSRDYSLGENNKQAKAEVTDSPKEFIQMGGINEEEATELARNEIAHIYETDCKNLVTTVEYDDIGGTGNIYRVILADSEDNPVYNITIDADLGKVTELFLPQQNPPSTNELEVDQDKITAKFEDAMVILNKIKGSEEKVVQSCCEYNCISEGVLERGVVTYLFETEEGVGYILKYNFAINSFFNILVMDYDGYRQIIEHGEKSRQKRGVVREVIPMQ